MLHLGIAVGGAAGALARYGAGLAAAALAGAAFPWGTLAVNVCGSWLLGMLMRLLPATTVSAAVRAALTIGFCGGFTTFSTFAHETVEFARAGEPVHAAGYVAASLLLGMGAMLAGMATGTWVTDVRRRRVAPARSSGEWRRSGHAATDADRHGPEEDAG